MDGWKEGWKEAKAGLRIAYSNQKVDLFRLSFDTNGPDSNQIVRTSRSDG